MNVQACIGISKKVKAGGDNSSQEVRIEINGLSQEAVEEAKQSFLKEMDKVMMIADWSSSSLRGAISNLDLCKVSQDSPKQLLMVFRYISVTDYRKCLC